MTVPLTPRETLSHDHVSALLRLQSETGKRGIKGAERVTWGQRGEGGKVKREGALFV